MPSSPGRSTRPSRQDANPNTSAPPRANCCPGRAGVVLAGAAEQVRPGDVHQPGRGQPERLALLHGHQVNPIGGSSRDSGVSSSGRAGSHPATTRVGRGGPSGRTGVAGAAPAGIATSPPAGRKPARVAESADRGSATNYSPIGPG